MRTSYRYCPECKSLHDTSHWPHQAEAGEAKYDPSAGYDDYLHGPRSGTFRRCQVCGEFHEISNWPHNHMPEQFDLAHEYAGIATISDNLEAQGGLNGLQSMIDGKFYTSKAKLRAEYRAHGVIEVGNDAQRFTKPKKPKSDRKAIRDAVKRAAWQVEHEGATAHNFRSRAKRQASAFGPVNKS